MGYSTEVELPSDAAEPGYTMTNGYSAEYVVTSAVPGSLDPTHQYNGNIATVTAVDTSSHGAAMLTYPNHYAAAAPMMTTVPYCTPLVADPYLVQHGGVTYPHQVVYTHVNFIIHHCSVDVKISILRSYCMCLSLVSL